MQINLPLCELNFEGKLISLDIETTGLKPWLDEIKLISIFCENQEYIFYPDYYDYEQFKNFIKSLQFCEKIINQNIKFDLGFIFYHYGVLLKNVHCTMVTQQILENGKQSELDFDIVSILDRTLHITHKYSEQKKLMQKSFGDEIIDYALELIPKFKAEQEEYAIEDVRHLIKLYHWQLRQLSLSDLEMVYRLEHKVMPVIVKMEIGGCKVDKKLWKYQIDTFWAPEVKEIEHKLDLEVNRLIKGKKWKYTTNRNRVQVTELSLFGSDKISEIESDNSLNYGSSDHILSLFELLGEPIPKVKAFDKQSGKKVMKPSVDEGALTVYLTEQGDTKLSKFIEILLEYRQISKLLSTYGDKFLDQLDENDYIHTQYSQTTTETSRLASKSPNLQNIPAADPEYPNKDIRKCFIASEGHSFVTCDMSGAEVAIAADLSREPLLVDSLEKGIDMHSILSSASYSIIFDKPTIISKSKEKFNIDGYEYIPNELRDGHKSVVFAKFYKGGAARVYGVLSKYINRHHKADKRKEISKKISDEFDKKVPVLSKYLSERIIEAQQVGYLRAPIFGRIRYFDQDAYGDAANYFLQCLNAEAIKLAMIKVDEYLTKSQIGRILLQIHDELCCEIKDEYAQEAAKKIQEIMAYSLGYMLDIIEGKASVTVAKHWKK